MHACDCEQNYSSLTIFFDFFSSSLHKCKRENNFIYQSYAFDLLLITFTEIKKKFYIEAMKIFYKYIEQNQ